MLDIGGKGFPRVKQFDMEERKTMIFNAKARTIGVSQTGMHFFFFSSASGDAGNNFVAATREDLQMRECCIFIVFDGEPCSLDRGDGDATNAVSSNNVVTCLRWGVYNQMVLFRVVWDVRSSRIWAFSGRGNDSRIPGGRARRTTFGSKNTEQKMPK